MRKYWLALLCSVIFSFQNQLPAQSLNISLASEVQLDADDNDARMYFPEYDQNDKLCALIKVKVTNKLQHPLMLETGAAGVQRREERENGEIWFWVPFKVKNLEFSCMGYREISPIPVHFESGKVYRLTLRSDANVTSVTNVSMSSNFLKMQVQPQDVLVYIGRTEACELHSEYLTDGFYQKRLDYGTYYYRIENSYYETKTGKLVVSEENKTHNIQLDPAYSYLDIRSEPSGATVIIDGKPLGKTPLKTTDKFKRGDLNVRLQLDEYATKVETIKVQGRGDVQVVNLKLDAQFANVTCKSKNSNAEIWVDGTKRGVGSWTGHLSSTTTHILEARLASHQSQSISFNVTAGQTLTKEVGAPVPLYGIISLETNPKNCIVSIDGNEVGNSPLMQNILIGEHKIAIRKEGYLTQQFTVNVEHQKTLDLMKTLEKGRLIADITLQSQAGVDLYAGSKYLGKADGNGRWSGKLEEGKYSFSSALPEHNNGQIEYEIIGKGPISVSVPAPVHKKGGVNIATRTGASIYMKREDEGGHRKVGTTNYRNTSLNTGQYSVYASKKGYHDSPKKYINVMEGRMTDVELSLKKDRWIRSYTHFDTKYFAEFNYGIGYNLNGFIPKYSYNYYGATFAFIPGDLVERWGGYATGLYGAEFGEFALTAGPLLRLNDDDYDWQLYLGAGFITGNHFNWLADAGLRFGLDICETEFEPLSLTLGAKFNNELVLPQLGVSFFPAALTQTENDDFNSWWLDYLTGYDAGYGSWAYGFSFGYCYSNLGFYLSMLWGSDVSSYVAGPVFRLTSDYNDYDVQLFAGLGLIDDEFGGDLGLRLDFGEDYGLGNLGLCDLSIGCQFYSEGVIPYLGMSWTLALVGGWLTSLFALDLDDLGTY